MSAGFGVCRHLPGESELARFAEGHGLAGVEENRDRQFPFFLVKFEKEPVQPAVEVPVEVAEVVARHVIPVVGELDRLPARLAAPLALERAFGAALREQLELLEAPEKFGSQEGCRHYVLVADFPDRASKRLVRSSFKCAMFRSFGGYH